MRIAGGRIIDSLPPCRCESVRPWALTGN